MLPYLRMMKDELDYDQVNDMVISQGTPKDYDYERNEMLVDIYFPHLKKSFQKILDARNELNTIIFDHKIDYKQGIADGHKFIDPLCQAIKKVHESHDCFKKELLLQSKVASTLLKTRSL